MMSFIRALIARLASTSLSALIRDQSWIIPTIQVVHILCVAIVFTAVVMLNLRLLRVFALNQPAVAIADQVVPRIWYVLAVLFVSGALLIVGEPSRALQSPAFAVKMCTLALVGVITFLVHRSLRRHPQFWELSLPGSLAGKLVGAVSLVLWLGVVFAGRWIAYIGVKQ